MSNYFVKNLPSIQEREFRYRTKMSSHELNELQQEAFADILDLFNKANGLQKTVYEMNLAHTIETTCYEQRLQQALAKLEDMEENYRNLTNKEKEYRELSVQAWKAETNLDGYNAIINCNTDDITAHVMSSKSKTRLYDETYDETLVPPNLQAYIGPDTFKVGENIYSIEDSNIMNAFDGKEETAWLRKIATSTDINEIENEIIIGLPEDIITTRLVNEIILKPFPAGYIDIMDIKYKSNGSWQTIPGFKQHHLCTEQEGTDIFGNKYTYNAINDAPALKFNFHSLQTNQIKIKLRQRHYIHDLENNRHIFYLGIKDCDILFNIYTRDYSVFTMTYDFPETDRHIKVFDAEVFFNNKDMVDDKNFGISKEFFYYDADMHPHKIASTCPFILEGHKLMVKYVIEGNQMTPNIYKTTIKYKLT